MLVLQLSSNFLFSVSVRCITTVHAAQGRYIDWFLLLNSYIEAVTPAALRFWSLRCLRDTTRPSTQIWSSVSLLSDYVDVITPVLLPISLVTVYEI